MKKFPSGRYDFMGHTPIPLKYHFQNELKKTEEKYCRITGRYRKNGMIFWIPFIAKA